MKITLENYNHKLTYETDCEDLTSTDMLKAFKALMIGVTFYESVVIDGMKEIIEEYDELRSSK